MQKVFTFFAQIMTQFSVITIITKIIETNNNFENKKKKQSSKQTKVCLIFWGKYFNFYTHYDCVYIIVPILCNYQLYQKIIIIIMYSAAKEKAGSKKSLRWNIRCHVWRKKYQNSFKASFPNKLSQIVEKEWTLFENSLYFRHIQICEII